MSQLPIDDQVAGYVVRGKVNLPGRLALRHLLKTEIEDWRSCHKVPGSTVLYMS